MTNCLRRWQLGSRFLMPLILVLLRDACAVSVNFTRALRAERLRAESLWRQGHGLLWFQHFRRAGGTSLCHLLRTASPLATFLLSRGEACQPEDWKLRDAMQICEHNLTLLAAEHHVLEFNSFAQEYGPIPGPILFGHRALRGSLRHWVFVASIRDPWSRFWSQLRYEMATCLVNAKALSLCVDGKFQMLGQYWSPTAHEDSILGVPGARLSESPVVYLDNYYTRVLVNRTDVDGPPLTWEDLDLAKALLTERFSAVVIAEDFAHSSLQLACSLGLDLEKAKPLLHTRIRPYSENEALMSGVPVDESELGEADVQGLRTKFVRNNKFDYTLYAHVRMLAQRRLALCTQRRKDVSELRRDLPRQMVLQTTSTTSSIELTIDDLFGCNGGTLGLDDKGNFMLYCPRTALQHSTSWWAGKSEDVTPKRKMGQPIPGKECWRSGFSWAVCCGSSHGPKGNADCWDGEFTHQRCCVY